MSQEVQRHPSVLYLLCLVEACERFAAGATLSLLALYLIRHRQFSESAALFIIGSYSSGSYLASWPAGWLADRHLGVQGIAQLGLLLMCLGYAALWGDTSTLLGPALAVSLMGQGAFRTALTTAVGRLYAPHDNHREAGFGLFYASANLGYLAGPLCAEAARVRAGWPAIFGLATAALVVAWILFLVSKGMIPGRRRVDSDEGGSSSARLERLRIRVLWLLSAVSAVFWFSLQQTGTSLVLFAESNTERHLSLQRFSLDLAPGHFATLHGALVLGLTPSIMALLSRLSRRGLAPSTPSQLVWGLAVTAGAFVLMVVACLNGGDRGRIAMSWLLGCYGLLSIAEVLWGALGLALVTRLAPPRIAARMAGLWYVAIATGHLGAGLMGPLWQRWPHHRYFACVAMLVLVAVGVLLRRLSMVEAALARRA